MQPRGSAPLLLSKRARLMKGEKWGEAGNEQSFAWAAWGSLRERRMSEDESCLLRIASLNCSRLFIFVLTTVFSHNRVTVSTWNRSAPIIQETALTRDSTGSEENHGFVCVVLLYIQRDCVLTNAEEKRKKKWPRLPSFFSRFKVVQLFSK